MRWLVGNLCYGFAIVLMLTGGCLEWLAWHTADLGVWIQE